MIKLDTITRSLQIVLSAAKTTTDMPVVVSYSERTATATTTTEGTQLASSNGTTPVTICAAPASSTIVRSVEHISVKNADTASKTVTINLLDTATSYPLITITMAVGDELIYSANAGWATLDQNGSIKMSYPSSIDSPAFTGTPTAPTAAVGTNTTQLATTAFVQNSRLPIFRNKIINGAMAIDQRNSGSSQTITAAAALAYTVDRWYAYCTGANVTGQRVAGSGSSQYRYQFTGAASVTAIGFAQRIEAINCYDLNNATATLSVDLANSLLATITWTAYYANSADTFGSLASPTKTQIATGTFTVTSTVTNYTTQISIPSAATTGIEILFTVGAQTSGTWTIGNVQLENGSIATPFERRLYSTELALCQRYHINATNHSIGVALNGTDTYSGGYFHLPVTMRTAPTLDAGATYAVSVGSAGTPSLLNTAGGHTTQDVALFTNLGTGWTNPARVEVTCGLSSEL